MRIFRSSLLAALLAVVAVTSMPALAAAQSDNLFDGLASYSLAPAGTLATTTAQTATLTNIGLTGKALVMLTGTNTAGSSPTLDAALYGSNDYVTWTPLTLYTNAAIDIGTTTNYAWNFSYGTSAGFSRLTTGGGYQVVGIDIGSAPLYIKGTNTIGGTGSPSYTISLTVLAKKKYR